MSREGLTLYFCYAQREKALRAALEAHLEPLKQQGLIRTWYDDQIRAGVEKRTEMRLHLQTADVILLLISSTLFASDDLLQEGISQALTRHERGEALIIPILMRPVDLEATPIGALRVLPSNGIPVSKWRNRDEALADIARGIRMAVNALLTHAVPGERTAGTTMNGTLVASDKQSSLTGKMSPPDQSIFFFNTPLGAVNEFYGRQAASTKLLSRAAKRASTSIVGPRRVGKTWLIDYLRQVAPAQFGFRFPSAYVDVTSPRCATIDGFVSLALEEWGYSGSASIAGTLPMLQLERTVKEMKRRDIIPLLYIDEFEGFTYHEEIFDLQFFANLRSIAGSGLVLVVASKRPPLDIINQEFQSSPFFNILEQITLKPFNEKEAEAFIQAKGDQAGFTAQEREYFKFCARVDEQGWPPARLQLVGTLLLEEKVVARQTHSDAYRPEDPSYWSAFARRVEEIYQKVVH